MPKLVIARLTSGRRPKTASIKSTDVRMPNAAAPSRIRVTAPLRTGCISLERWAIRSSVRIAPSRLDVFAQGFYRAVHRDFDRGFRQAGLCRHVGDRHAIQLDVLDQLALGGRQLFQKLGDISACGSLGGIVMTEQI